MEGRKFKPVESSKVASLAMLASKQPNLMKQEALYRRLSARICRIFSSAEASRLVLTADTILFSLMAEMSFTS